MDTSTQGRSARRVRFPRSWWTRSLLAVAAVAVILVPAAWANHLFSDVPAASPHHNAISAIAGAGITGGCAPGLYCPANSVRRDEMASFLQRGLGRTGSSGTTAGVALTGAFASIATETITAGGAGSGSGFVVLLGSFSVENPAGNTGPDHRIEFRLREVSTGFLSNVSEVTLNKMDSLATDARPSAAVAKQWVFTIPAGATRTYSLDARVAFPAAFASTEALSRLLTVFYIPFGPSGTSSPLGTTGTAGVPAPGTGSTDIR